MLRNTRLGTARGRTELDCEFEQFFELGLASLMKLEYAAISLSRRKTGLRHEDTEFPFQSMPHGTC
ncbi:protein of unknown function [Methylocaldum szegediense]|uniref:Uncharacterized protein n=1 Tax=Methylocaldum szegediense TaxID=73780 RepID=A0ABN8X0L6_9GAMM|nr:protein of unknown function [Methylocaldum szegediense]